MAKRRSSRHGSRICHDDSRRVGMCRIHQHVERWPDDDAGT
jgi:hypothetical protein